MGVIFVLWRPQNAKNRTEIVSFAVFWPPKAENNLEALVTIFLFKIWVFCVWPLEATKCEKPYSVDPKILSLDLKIVSFAIFWPPEAENNILTLCQFIFVTGTLKWFTMITA